MANNDWTDGTEILWENSPWELLPGVRSGDELSRGEKAADIVRNKMGSWGFVAFFTGFMLIWAVVNMFLLANKGWDPYPFILLNLMLSALAGLQGAILLIAAKRADAVAAEQALSHLTISKTSGEMLREIKAEMGTIKRLAHEIYQHTKEGK
jgi:hypothetical protein